MKPSDKIVNLKHIAPHLIFLPNAYLLPPVGQAVVGGGFSLRGEWSFLMPEKTDLSLFFEPQSVAVIGSLKEGYFGGYAVIKTMLHAGFKGKSILLTLLMMKS